MSGRLAWSKVRLLARFVTREDEAHCIARAEGTSVKILERELRAVERGARGASSSVETESETDEPGVRREPADRVAIHVAPALAFMWQRSCRAAAQVAGETTPPASVLEWVSAEVVAGLPLPSLVSDDAEADAEAETGGEARDSQSGLQPAQEAVPDAIADEIEAATNVCAPHSSGAADPAHCAAGEVALPPFLRVLHDGVDQADPFTLDARLGRAIRLEQRLNAEIAARLRVVADADFEWRTRYRSLDELAREGLGSRASAWA